MKSKQLAILLLALAPMSLHGADWQVIGVGDSGIVCSADRASLKRTGNVVRVWMRTNELEARLFAGRPFRSMRSLEFFDCVERKYAGTAITLFAEPDLKGAVVHTSSQDESTMRWNNVPPDTIAEMKLDWVCKNAPSK